MLLNHIEADLQRLTRRSFALTPATLAVLRFYATGTFLEVIVDGHGLSKASVSRSVQAVTTTLLWHIPDHIQIPTTRGDKSAAQDLGYLQWFLWFLYEFSLPLSPFAMCDFPVNTVESFHFLGATISQHQARLCHQTLYPPGLVCYQAYNSNKHLQCSIVVVLLHS